MNKKASLLVNFVIGSLAAASIVVFFYALHRSGIHPSGWMTKYYAASITSALFFLFILFKCGAETKAKVALLLVSTIFSIYAVELLLAYNRNIKPEHIRAELAKKAGKHYDTRHRIRVWMDLRSKGINAYPLYNPYTNMDLKDTDTLPLGFISNTTALFCNEGGEFIVFRTDEHGFSNPQDLYRKYIDNVLIGDSFAQGACVRPEENIAGWLTKAGIEVLNLGMLNSGPPNQLAILKEYSKPLEPGNVFWLFYEGNDHEGLEFEKKSRIFPKYLEKGFSQKLISKQELLDKMLIEEIDKEFKRINENMEKVQELIDNSPEASFRISLSSITLPNLRRRLGLTDEGCHSLYEPLFKVYLAEAKRTVESWGGRMVFVYLPSYYRYAEKVNKCKIRSHDESKRDVMKAVKSLGIPIVDVQENFDSHPDPLSFFSYRTYGHYNSGGYKMVADQLEKHLKGSLDNPEDKLAEDMR